MTTRQQRAEAATARKEATLEKKHQQWLRLANYIYPLIVEAMDPMWHSDEYVLHSRFDITQTARQLRDEYGPLASDIISRLFMRWQTKAKTRHGPRLPRWRLNILNISIFNKWLIEQQQNGVKVTCRQVLDFLKAAGFEELRRITINASKTHETMVMTNAEAKELLDVSLREHRKAWAKAVFAHRDDVAKEQHNATHH